MKREFEMTKGAIFGDDRTRRYILFRIWDESKPKMMFIGLNPPTANETKNDNTICKVIKIAEHNGFGGVYMANLFSFVTAYPNQLIIDDDQKWNNHFLLEYGMQSKKIVFAWGNFKAAKERSKIVIALFPKSYCIVKNKNGSPKHPLYCLDKSILIPFIK